MYSRVFIIFINTYTYNIIMCILISMELTPFNISIQIQIFNSALYYSVWIDMLTYRCSPLTYVRVVYYNIYNIHVYSYYLSISAICPGCNSININCRPLQL